MARTITVTLPDGYEDAQYLVAVHGENIQRLGRTDVEWSSTVLGVASTTQTAIEVEEIGCGPLAQIVTEAARLIHKRHTPRTTR